MNGWVLPPDDLVWKPLKFFLLNFDFWMNIYNEINSVCTFEWRICFFAMWWNVCPFSWMKYGKTHRGMAWHGTEWSVDMMSNRSTMTSSWEIYVCANAHTRVRVSSPFISWLIYLFVNQISHFGWAFVYICTDVALNYNHCSPQCLIQLLLFLLFSLLRLDRSISFWSL